MRADPRRIHELEYDLGYRDDPPPARTQSAAASAVLKEAWTSDRPTVSSSRASLASVLREVWTDDFASQETGEPGTHVVSDDREPLSFAIFTEGFEHITRVRFEPRTLVEEVGGRVGVALNHEMQDALQQHREAIRRERLYPNGKPAPQWADRIAG